MDTNKKIGGGLRKDVKDRRDFKFGVVFQLPKLEELPKEFNLGDPLRIADQGDSDLCTGFASCAVSEDQEHIALSPEYVFAKTKELEGDYTTWGADLRMACKAQQKFGTIEKKLAPFNLETHSRDFVANWLNWPTELSENALSHRKVSYFLVTGPYDVFDNFRATLWANREEKQSIITGCLWHYSWTGSPNGIIPKFSLDRGEFGHAFKIFGWKEIAGEPYLIAQLSNGTQIGDKGIFFFPRNVVNKEFFNAYTFKDVDPVIIKLKYVSRWDLFVEWLKRYFNEIFS